MFGHFSTLYMIGLTHFVPTSPIYSDVFQHSAGFIVDSGMCSFLGSCHGCEQNFKIFGIFRKEESRAKTLDFFFKSES